MAFKYKNKKTDDVVVRKTPMDREKKQDYILLSWSADAMIKAEKVTKK